MKHKFYVNESRLLGTIGRFTIEAAMHEVDLHDGSIHALHFVRDPADPETRSRYLRALQMSNGTVAIFDLRHLARTLASELPCYTERDRPGLVKYTLRGLYSRAADLHLGVQMHWVANGCFEQQLAVAA